MTIFDRFNLKVVAAAAGLCGAALSLSPTAAAVPLKTGGHACGIQGMSGTAGAARRCPRAEPPEREPPAPGRAAHTARPAAAAGGAPAAVVERRRRREPSRRFARTDRRRRRAADRHAARAARAPAALEAVEDLAHGDAVAYRRAPITGMSGVPVSCARTGGRSRAGGRPVSVVARAGGGSGSRRRPVPVGAPVPVGSTRAPSAPRDRFGRPFETHPDAAIYRSLPGQGSAPPYSVIRGDPDRFPVGSLRPNYGGHTPAVVGRKRRCWLAVRNRCRYAAIDQAICAGPAPAPDSLGPAPPQATPTTKPSRAGQPPARHPRLTPEHRLREPLPGSTAHHGCDNYRRCGCVAAGM